MRMLVGPFPSLYGSNPCRCSASADDVASYSALWDTSGPTPSGQCLSPGRSLLGNYIGHTSTRPHANEPGIHVTTELAAALPEDPTELLPSTQLFDLLRLIHVALILRDETERSQEPGSIQDFPPCTDGIGLSVWDVYGKNTTADEVPPEKHAAAKCGKR